MPGKKTVKMEINDVLKHPVVLSVTDDSNPELLERRQYSPPVCKVFSRELAGQRAAPFIQGDDCDRNA